MWNLSTMHCASLFLKTIANVFGRARKLGFLTSPFFAQMLKKQKVGNFKKQKEEKRISSR